MDLIELKPAHTSNTHQRHPWELARHQVVLDLIRKEIADACTRPLTILDVGCGDTFLIEQLSQAMLNARFVAIDTAFTKEMLMTYQERFERESMPIEVYASLAEAMAHRSEAIDLVLLLDVIEHIADEKAFLKQLQTTAGITEVTRFLITVPAYQSLFCAHDVFLKHYRRYTNATLEKAVRWAGLHPLRKGYFFASLLLPRLIQVLAETLSQSSQAKGIGAWQGPVWKTKLLTSILWLDYRFSSALRKGHLSLPGLSNFMVCKKSA